MAASESDRNEDPSDKSDAEEALQVEPTKLPAAREHGLFGKPPTPEFRDDLEENFQAGFFSDKRYGTFRKQMTVAAAVIVLATITFGILFWFFPVFEEPEAAIATGALVPSSASGLSREQARQLQLDTLREQLRESVATSNWSAIDQLAGAVLKMEPADGEAWSYVALINEKSGNPREALEAYSKAIDAQFLPSFTLLKRAGMYRLLGNFPAAIADLQESARLDPQSIAVPNLILISQIQAGEAETVRKDVENFQAAGLESTAHQYLLGKAALALHDGDPAKAAAILTQYQALVPPEVFAQLLQDPFFAPYRNEVALLPFFLNN